MASSFASVPELVKKTTYGIYTQDQYNNGMGKKNECQSLVARRLKQTERAQDAVS
jgi:hypothetical protein